MEDVDFEIFYVAGKCLTNTLEAILDLVVTKTAEVIFDAINEFFDP